MTHPLPSCIHALQSSIRLLSSSIDILSSSVDDYPRLGKVLQTTRHFELLPESTLHSAQAQLLSSLTPELNTLFARIESSVEKLERRAQALQARSELLEGRLSMMGGRGEEIGKSDGQEGDDEGESENGIAKGAYAEEGEEEEDALEKGRQELRVRQMQQRKQRLSYAVERLTLQADQKERQLRKSVARE